MMSGATYLSALAILAGLLAFLVFLPKILHKLGVRSCFGQPLLVTDGIERAKVLAVQALSPKEKLVTARWHNKDYLLLVGTQSVLVDSREAVL
jgi:hypothetical protein